MKSEFFTAGLDLESLPFRSEAQAACCTVIHELNMCVFKFEHLSAVDTNKVIVRWAFDEVRVVSLLVIAEIDFVQEASFYEQGNGAIHRGP